MAGSKAQELMEEFRTVVAGRSNLLDTVIPPVLFLLANALSGFQVAVSLALLLGALITLLRLVRRQPLMYAFGGLGGVLLAVLISRWLGREEAYFLPGIVSGAGTAMLCVASVLLGKPLVAWTSHLARRWPLSWYWHAQVRPAYNEVTLLWAVYFTLRLALQILAFQNASATLLATLQFLTGWPATIALLVASYLYGTWRLRVLKGPSVEEFQVGDPPPWSGQQRGF